MHTSRFEAELPKMILTLQPILQLVSGTDEKRMRRDQTREVIRSVMFMARNQFEREKCHIAHVLQCNRGKEISIDIRFCSPYSIEKI